MPLQSNHLPPNCLEKCIQEPTLTSQGSKKERFLQAPARAKKTYHIALDIENSELNFKVGDSIGVLPANDPRVVDQIIRKLGATGNEEIEDPRTKMVVNFREFLLNKANLSKVSFHKIYNVEKTSRPLIELVEQHQPSPHELCKVLLPLLPRFYSIASSPKIFPHEIHLTVAFVSFELNGQTHFGVGSHFLCEQAKIESTPIPIYVQPSNHFTLPEDPDASIILIGPGTGIAPFRAFLQERMAMQAPGRNWIFFGERNRATDFYYGDYLMELEKQGRIRLETAFSRDQPEKIYVQHRILEQRKSFWQWIQEGSLIYLCGDADQMAKDVYETLLQIGREDGGMSHEGSIQFFKQLKQEKRFLLDVY